MVTPQDNGHAFAFRKLCHGTFDGPSKLLLLDATIRRSRGILDPVRHPYILFGLANYL